MDGFQLPGAKDEKLQKPASVVTSVSKNCMEFLAGQHGVSFCVNYQSVTLHKCVFVLHRPRVSQKNPKKQNDWSRMFFFLEFSLERKLKVKVKKMK